jgi:hypothetical protein
VIQLKELWKDQNYTYLKLEQTSEVDNFRIKGIENEEGGFDFFKGLGIIGYPSTFKAWLRKFPRPIFLVASRGKEIVSWIFVEEWEEVGKDGFPVYVLRAIETLPGLRSKRIGFRLFLLVLKETAGHLITKPLTPQAKEFFKRIGFLEEDEMKRPPIDLSHRSNYLVFPVHIRKEMLDTFAEYLV